jgi:hypothetical protein
MRVVGDIFLVSIVVMSCGYWINAFGRALLVDWVGKRERQEHRATVIRRLLMGQTDSTIDWVIYGDKGRPQGLRHLMADAVEKRVRTWKEWQERGADGDWSP